MAERVAIAIPFYAGLAYLEEALASVRAQSDPEWTALVVDDSPEKGPARALVERLGDARVRYAANDGNLGMVASWNRCLDLADGELVTLLHGDDRLLPNYVAEMRALAARHPGAVALFPASVTIDAAGERRFSLQDDIKRLFVPRGGGDVVLAGEPGLRALMRADFIVCPSVCWRRAVLGERRFDGKWRQVQDLELFARLLFAGETLAGIRTAAYAYRRHDANATARQTESLLRFAEEFELFDRVAADADARGWPAAARTSRHKAIVRLHLGWRGTRALLSGDVAGAARSLGVLAGVEPLRPDPAGAAAGAKVGELTGAAGGALAAQLVGMALVFLTQVVLARALGAEGFGALAYTLTWAEVLGLVAPLGFDKLQIRELARFHAEESAGLARGLLRCAARWTVVGTLATVAVALAFGFAMRARLDPAIVPVFWLVAVLVPLRAWANLRHGALLGLSRPVAGMLATSVTHALVLLPLAGLAAWLFPARFDARGAAWLAAAGWLVAFLVADRQLRGALGSDVRGATPIERAREWRAEAWPMLLIVGLALLSLNADVLMLGAMRGAREAGIYRVAAQFAFLVRLGLVAVNPVLAPLAVRATSSSELRAVALRGTRLAFVAAALVTAALLIAGPWLLRLYDPEFAAGARAMAILALGFLLVTAMGPVETILLMKREQRLAAAAAAGACALNVVLNWFLIPSFGMEGAALATASAMIVWSVSMSVAIRRRLGFGMSLLSRS